MIKIEGNVMKVLYPNLSDVQDDFKRNLALHRAFNREWSRIQNNDEYMVSGLSPFKNFDISYRIFIGNNGSTDHKR